MESETNAGSPAGPIDAAWRVELNCYCPYCEEYVDLLIAPDFWDGRRLRIAETGTEQSDALEVQCPECDYEFVVRCNY